MINVIDDINKSRYRNKIKNINLIKNTNTTNKIDNKIEYENIKDIDNYENNYSDILKVILLGDTNTGKTSFVNKLTNSCKDDTCLTTTIGVDFAKHSIKYKDTIIRSILWDTAGMETYGSIVTSYYRMIDGVIIFFDLNNFDSYQSFEYWLNDVIYYVKTGIIYIIGNKSDLEKKISKSDVVDFINSNYKNYEIYYKEISIKNNIPNVKDIYAEYIINLFRKINNKKSIINNTTVKIGKKENKKCCF
tara:strand:+ start:1608 stop:2348 length:741 start_codon:yes stop_codon:yes gene_type:complete